MESDTNASSSAPGRGRGRGRSRGGLGKFLRARGRGHRGGGRPAVFHERLTLEGEGEGLDEEEAAELAQKYRRRQLGTNADRYEEPEPELDSDGEEVIEPEVDLSQFLERQRLEDAHEPSFVSKPDDDDDVDHSLAHISSSSKLDAASRKGKVQQIQWDESLEQMSREKAIAEAHRDLKGRFKVSATQQRGKSATLGTNMRSMRKRDKVMEAPPLPVEPTSPHKGDKEQMEDFLDDLLG